MATVITEECINCAACEPECPNTAIYQGGVEYEFEGAKLEAISADLFYIVPEKCTECVGFFDEEACAAVCPVDCCIPDPERPEDEAALLERAKVLHPDEEFPEDFPSRFKTPVAEPVQAAGGPDGAQGGSNGAAAGQTVSLASSASEPRGGRVERAIKAPTVLASGDPGADFEAELGLEFTEVMEIVSQPDRGAMSSVVGALVLLASPVLGALDHRTKKGVELAVSDGRFFSAQRATALNILSNFVLYPVAAYVLGLVTGLTPFTEADKTWIVAGLGVAMLETVWRLGSDLFKGVPVSLMTYGPSFYGAPLGLVLRPLVARLVPPEQRSGRVPVEGFYAGEFEEKRERERRYGEVYTVTEFDRGYHIRFELPRAVPPSGAKEDLGVGDEMPDYDLGVEVGGSAVTIKGSVVDSRLRAMCGVSSAFPADFKTDVQLGAALGGFRHRYADKLLEIAVIKQGG